MRRSDNAFTPLGPAKAPFARALAAEVAAVPGVVSVTFTGSFVDQADLGGISDIDVIVVVDRLTPAIFAACEKAASAVSCELLGLPDHRLHLNTSFGPLKFDGANRVVVHLMVYSVDGHRTHVLKSPFTCLDWERSAVHLGPSLRELYPVLGLQPRQLLDARRGLADYLDDLEACAIRFRKYVAEGDTLVEVTDRLPLDPRHQGEFAYHIIRNLIGNYAKIVLRSNLRLSSAELIAFWETALPVTARFCAWFREIERLKRARAHDYPADTLATTRDFLRGASEELDAIWRQRAVRHVFIRHARTALNDGRFLGQGRDPEISETPAPLHASFDRVFASPARRTQQTAAALVTGGQPAVDPRLHEIDYGRAEGLSFGELTAAFPELAAAWRRGEDAPFPGGENSANVLARLESFLAELPARPALVVTHNVVLRCLLGSGLGLPMAQWHRIPVEHCERIEVLRLDGRTWLELSAAQLEKITDAVCSHRHS